MVSIYWIVRPRPSRQVTTHFIDYEKIGVGDARSPLPRDLVSTLGIDGINMGPLEAALNGCTKGFTLEHEQQNGDFSQEAFKDAIAAAVIL